MQALDPIHAAPEKLARWLDVARGFSAIDNVLVIQRTSRRIGSTSAAARR